MAQGNPGPPGGGSNNQNRRAARGNSTINQGPPFTRPVPRNPNDPLNYRGPRLNLGTPTNPIEHTSRPR